MSDVIDRAIDIVRPGVPFNREGDEVVFLGEGVQQPTSEEWSDAIAQASTIPPVELVVSAAQAKLALYNAGLYSTVVYAVSQVGYEPIRIYFENASEWHIGNPYVQGLAAYLELTDEQVAALFEAARAL
jgi:hypothetical protein